MLKSGWTRRDHPNMLMFWYEEIHQNPKLLVKTILKHIGYELSEQKIDELCEALTFSQYKKISTMNTALRPNFQEGQGEFTRKGEVGDWVNHFDEVTCQLWDAWIVENLERLGITETRIKAFFLSDD